MNRSRNLVDSYYNRNTSLHKPGMIPNSSRIISPITANRHKYELKQRIWPQKTVEAWFANHSSDERRAVYSFLDTLYNDDDADEKYEKRQKSASPRLSRRINTPSSYSTQQKLRSNSRQSSRASQRDLGEVLESLERFRPSSSVQEKGVQTSSTPVAVPLPEVNGTNMKRPSTSIPKQNETVQFENSSSNLNDKASQRYLSHTWRVINPREDAEPVVRPEHNASSFFNYTKKTYPEYFFIHPDWY